MKNTKKTPIELVSSEIKYKFISHIKVRAYKMNYRFITSANNKTQKCIIYIHKLNNHNWEKLTKKHNHLC